MARMESRPDRDPKDDGAERFDALYRELHQMAGRLFRSQRSSHTLQPTALVHEAYLKMARTDAAWNDRTHFLATAARAMRQILVNHARDRGAAKRGGGVDRQRVTLSDVSLRDGAPDLDVLTLNDALEELSALDVRQGRVAELRLFAGLTNRETADAIGVSLRTVELEWRMAKDFLAQRLGDGTP
jgi:RNA polymerase sigma factor (TIGR02999 family)